MTPAGDKAPFIIASLIVVLLTAHVSQDVVYGIEQGDLSDLIAAVISGVWLYFAIALAGRRSGYLLLLVAAFLAPVVSLAHMSGDGVRDDIPAGAGFFFVWTLLGLGATAPVSLLLSIQGLWRLRSSVLGFLIWTAIPLGLGGGLIGYVAYQLN
jgi:hypothetical protein